MAPQRGFHVGGPISRLQLVRYVQAPTLAWPPVRAHPDLSSRAAGPYTPRNGRAVSHSNCGIATCPNRATDMPGLSPGRSWPYRPLHYPRGPRSSPGYVVPVHHRLIDPMRPTHRHSTISPHGGLYALPSLCPLGPRRPASGSELSLTISLSACRPPRPLEVYRLHIPSSFTDDAGLEPSTKVSALPSVPTLRFLWGQLFRGFTNFRLRRVDLFALL